MIALFVLQSVIYAKSIRKSRKVNRKICYSKQGKTALIIAGGPSSGFLDIDQVISEQSNGDLDVFAMNWYTNRTNPYKSDFVSYFGYQIGMIF